MLKTCKLVISRYQSKLGWNSMINWQGIKFSSILFRKLGLWKHDLVICLEIRNIVNKYACFNKFSLYHITKTSYYILHERIQLGMATGRVRAGFFHTRTRPAGQDPWPGPAPFRVPGFFPGPRPAPVGPHGPRGPRLEIGPKSWPNQKKKKKKKTQMYFFLRSSLHI